MSARNTATAFAPASVGNVAVGFDILGHAVGILGDRVTVTRIDAPEVRIVAIEGAVVDLPQDPRKNTAGQCLLTMRDVLKVPFGVEVRIHKGIPLGSGLGGSAASAVAAAVAMNALLETPLSKEKLLPFVLAGEAVAAGSAHLDNVAPSLLGGLMLCSSVDPPRVRALPIPDGIRCVLVHPSLVVETKQARGILRANYTLHDLTAQMACLGEFVAACLQNDREALRYCLKDLLIEPQRKILIPGFDAIQHAALQAGALGCSISGSGPTIFAWSESATADTVAQAMTAAATAQNLACRSWVCDIDQRGAYVATD